jgi:hypothetical protein
MSKPGLWANIHAKRERIAAGSGERMRKPGSPGAPTAADFRASSSDKKVDRALRVARKGRADGGEVTTSDVRRLLSDQVTNRATLLPLADYADGSTRLAVPGIVYEPAAAWRRMMDSGYRPGDDEQTRQMAEDSFTVAGAVPVAGLASAAVRPGASIGSGGGRIKGYHGTEHADRIGRNKPDRMWFTGDRTNQSADAANSYAYGRGHQDVPAVYRVEGRFDNPLEVDGRGNHFQFIDFEGRKIGPDSLADEAARRGHDALVVKNVKDHASSYDNTPEITSVAALRPGTVFDDYGNQLFSNSSKASTPGLAALESNRVRGGLPMDEASRMARARELGYDTDRVWYHGTNERGYTELKPDMRDPGLWLTTDKMNASNYARGDDADLHYLRAKPGKSFVVESADDVTFKPSHEGSELPFDNNVDIVRHAFANGYDSVRFPYGNFSESGDTLVVRRGNQVRSVDAEFDPSKASSTNLLAANPSTAAILAFLDKYREKK